MKKRSLAAALATLAASLSIAQSSIPSTNALQAIVGARIEVGNGTVIDRGTILMRDGAIVAVGPEVHVPPGAQILDGGGLTVYPGFIEAYTSRGLQIPEVAAVADGMPAYSDYTPSFMPTENRKGIRPDLAAARYFAPSDEVLRPYRNSGFTSAVVAPTGYIGGIAALMNLGSVPPSQNTVDPSVGLAFSFGGVTGPGYPRSVLGAIAQMRQALYDAATYEIQANAYQTSGGRRPAYDEGLIAIATHRRDLSLFDASTAAQIDRVLMISEEFGLRPAIVGGAEAWRRSAELKARQVPVIVQLGFGAEPTAPKREPTQAQGDDPGDLEDAPERTQERRRLFLESVSNANLLYGAGIPIAFTTRGNRTPQEFMENLRRAVKEGMSREAALKGLTVSAAKLLGVDRRLGTIEAGKTANLTVMSGDFLDEKAKVRMLYIDGRRIDPAATPPQPTQRGRFGEGEGK